MQKNSTRKQILRGKFAKILPGPSRKGLHPCKLLDLHFIAGAIDLFGLKSMHTFFSQGSITLDSNRVNKILYD